MRDGDDLCKVLTEYISNKVVGIMMTMIQMITAATTAPMMS